MEYFMKFFKENSYDIVKLIINQIGIAIFSLVLYTAIGFLEDAKLSLSIKIALSVFSTLFYFVLLYTAAWEFGAKDKIRVDSGKMASDPLKGAKLGLLANLPNVILAALSVISLSIYMAARAEWVYTLFGIVNFIMRFVLSTYIGMLQGIFSGLNSVETQNLYHLGQSFGFLLFPLLAAGVVAFGYYMGLINKRIFSSGAKKSN